MTHCSKRLLLRRAVLVVLSVGLAANTAETLCADPPPSKLVVATWNLEWFYDENTGDNYADLAKQQSAPSRQQWEWKRDGVASAIAKIQPTILALQEVENQRVLYYLHRTLRERHQVNYRTAFIQGGDYYTEQDVALLFRSGLIAYCRHEQSLEMWRSEQFHNVQKHIFGRFEWGEEKDRQSLTVVNVHFRAMSKAAAIRVKQARLIRYWIRHLIQQGENLIVLGDFNSDESFKETSSDSELGILRGLNTPNRADDLIDLNQFLDPQDRGTHLLPGKQFDRILVSPSLMRDEPDRRDFVFESISRRKDLVVQGQAQDDDHWNKFYDIPLGERDLSDHYPLVATFAYR